jgi:hypothetical protein
MEAKTGLNISEPTNHITSGAVPQLRLLNPSRFSAQTKRNDITSNLNFKFNTNLHPCVNYGLGWD